MIDTRKRARSQSVSKSFKLDNQLKNLYPAKKSSREYSGVISSFGANTHNGTKRNYNEDRVSIIMQISNPKKDTSKQWGDVSFFAIYDGHAGSLCCDFLKEKLHYILVT